MKLDNIISVVAITVMVVGLFIFIWLIREEIKSEKKPIINVDEKENKD
jgi:nitrogen fixation-related uncharacterized protein